MIENNLHTPQNEGVEMVVYHGCLCCVLFRRLMLSYVACVLGEQLLCILAVALGNAFRELGCSFYHCIVVFNFTSHIAFYYK